MRTKEQDKKVYFITGGGTGGHIYPALAVANSLKDENKVFYIGNPKKPEARLSKENGLEFLPVNISYMPRKINFGAILWLFQLTFAVITTMIYIFKYRPCAVFATGGYVSAPLLIASIFCRMPFMMHDGDAVPGIVTRKISSFAKCVSLTFEDAKKFVKNKNIHFCGNPIREDFATLNKSEARKLLNLDNERFILLVMGGSQGAKGINSAIVKLYRELTEKYNLSIIHQTGDKNYEEVLKELDETYSDYKNNSSIIVKPYFENSAIPMKAADIAISRAGSLSISELCASGLASILVPYPYAAANHQYKNAKAIEQQGAAFCVEERECLSEELLNILENLIKDNSLREGLQNEAMRLARPNARVEIVELLKGIARE